MGNVIAISAKSAKSAKSTQSFVKVPHDSNGNSTSTFASTINFLQNSQIKLSFDSFSQRFFVDFGGGNQELSKTAIDKIMFDLLSIETISNFRLNDLIYAVEAVGRQNTFNSMSSFIDSLKGNWDGTERIDTFFQKYLGAEEKSYVSECSRIFFTQALKRLIEPGCKAELMLVLCGEQGIGKSEFLKKISPPSKDLVLEVQAGDFGKELQLKLQGRWLVEFSELASIRKREAEEIKSFLSTQVDILRKPYSIMPDQFKRSCVFVGTTNEKNFLKDETGNRRFLPIRCSRVWKNVFSLTEEEVMQVWSEAFVLLENGFESWRVPATLSVESQRFSLSDDFFEERLEIETDYFLEKFGYVRLSELISKLWKSDVYTQSKVKEYLRQRGLSAQKVRIPGFSGQVRIWAPFDFKPQND